MADQITTGEKIIEKHYLEAIPASAWKKFWSGFLQGIGYGVGLSVGTALVLAAFAFIVSKADLVPVFGSYLSKVLDFAIHESRTTIGK